MAFHLGLGGGRTTFYYYKRFIFEEQHEKKKKNKSTFTTSAQAGHERLPMKDGAVFGSSTVPLLFLAVCT